MKKKIKLLIVCGLCFLWTTDVCQILAQEMSTIKPNIRWTFDVQDLAPTNSGLKFKARDSRDNIIKNTRNNSLLMESSNNRSRSQFVDDRYGKSSKAYVLKDKEVMVFTGRNSSFYGLSNNENIDEFTVSVWLEYTSPSDEERLIFGAKKARFDSGPKFGLSLIGTKLYLKQYHEKWSDDGTKTVGVAWSYRLIEPAAFDAGYGWYNIIAVFAKKQKYMRVFLGKPNNGAVYGEGTNKVRREFDGRLIWIPGIKKGLSDFSKWFVGPASGLVFDNIDIYNKALSLEQAKEMFNQDKTNNLPIIPTPLTSSVGHGKIIGGVIGGVAIGGLAAGVLIKKALRSPGRMGYEQVEMQEVSGASLCNPKKVD